MKPMCFRKSPANRNVVAVGQKESTTEDGPEPTELDEYSEKVKNAYR